MYIMFLLLAVSLAAALIFLAAYIWSVRSGQFDDKYTPSVRILFDDKKSKNTNTNLDSEEKVEEKK